MNNIIIKYNEIILKGKNKDYFERILIKNIKDCFKRNKINHKNTRKTHNQLIIRAPNNNNLKNIFGIAYICKATKTQLSIKEIGKQALKLAKNTNFKTFKISTKRANKKFKYNSMEINRKIGSIIQKKTNTKVDLTNPDLEIFVEILDSAYIHSNKVKGPGGLPVGSEGKVISLIEDRSSILATLLAMKRGCSIIPAYFKKIDIKSLNKYSYNHKLKPIKIKNIEEIDKITKQKKAKALVVNQTLTNFKTLPIKTPILRPLISFTDNQIKEKLAKF